MARRWIERCVDAFCENSSAEPSQTIRNSSCRSLASLFGSLRRSRRSHGVRVRPLADPAPVHLRLSRAWKNRMATPPRLGVTASRILALQPHRRSCRSRWRLVVCPDLPSVLGTGSSLAADPPGQFLRTNDRGVAFSRPPLLADLRAFEAQRRAAVGSGRRGSVSHGNCLRVLSQ